MDQSEIEAQEVEILRLVQSVFERCAKIAEGEKVEIDDKEYETDIAYNLACDHIAAAIRAATSV